VVTFFRNKLYDWNIFKSYEIPGKSICVGNLSTGGTGKTPHVSYLAEYLKDRRSTAILSRGYGRKTTGFLWVKENSKTSDVGDEPLYYAKRFASVVKVAVCEQRAEGVKRIQQEQPENELIILDDAYQHRGVKAGFNVLLTDYQHPFYADHMLPTGDLREWTSGKDRADCIIVTKCPTELNESAKKEIRERLKFDPQRVFFSHVSYSAIKPLNFQVEDATNVLLVTGIANATPLLRHLTSKYSVEHLEYGDHYAFTASDIQEIHQKFDTFTPDPKIIMTTEKDFMRLKDRIKDWKLDEYPWYYQPISIEIEEEEKFKALINSYVDTV
jgi:tetraacyldisaccharide 4'-kinase